MSGLRTRLWMFRQYFDFGRVEDCWEWRGGITGGYGRFHCPELKEVAAHRIAYIFFKGLIPDGLFVLHNCDNMICVNPNHLFLGTQKQNCEDCKAKDRHVRGPRNGMCRIPTGLIEPIRRARNEERRLLREVAEEFGISTSQVSVIARGIQRTIA